MFKLHHPCLTEDQQAHAELKWKYRQSSSGNVSTRSFAVWLSLFSFSSKSLIEDGGVAALPIPQLIGLVV